MDRPMMHDVTAWAKMALPYTILFVLGAAAASFGAILGGDAMEAARCQCDVGMVTYGQR